MIPVTHDHPRSPLHECAVPCVIVGEQTAHTVSLKIGLIHHIQAILVAKLIYIWIVRIMTCTDRIEVELFHQADISLHLLPCQSLSTGLAMIVAIHSVKFHRHSVHKELLTVDTDIAETDLAAAGLNHITVSIEKRKHQCIEYRGYGMAKYS